MSSDIQTYLSSSNTTETLLQEAETLIAGFSEPSVHERFRSAYDELTQLYRHMRRTRVATAYRAKLRELFYRKKDLYQRGWSRRDIDTLLGGAPDFVVQTERGLAHLYFKRRVLDLEATPAWYRRPRAEARRLRKEGLTHRAIAERLNLSLGEVVLATRELRTPRRPQASRRMPLEEAKSTARAMRAAGKTQVEIREVTGLALGTISKVTADIEKPGPRAAEAQRLAREMKAQGHTRVEISEATGRSLVWVSQVTAGVEKKWQPSPVQRAILELLADGQEWRTAAIVAAVSASRRNVAGSLKRLVTRGEIQKVRHGVYQQQKAQAVLPEET